MPDFGLYYEKKVCLDEAQMVESTIRNAAGKNDPIPVTIQTLVDKTKIKKKFRKLYKLIMCSDNNLKPKKEMACMIPRIHSWAVTGTPIGKYGISDLYGLIVFLGLRPFSESKILWNRIISTTDENTGTVKYLPNLQLPIPNHYPLFLSILRKIMHRNTKRAVRSELQLPPQTQYTYYLEFSRVEQHYYDQLWETCMGEVGDRSVGGRKRFGGEIEETARVKMKSWILRLRQTW